MTNVTKMGISKESAALQMQVFYDHYDVDISALPDEVGAAVSMASSKLIKAIRRERLEVIIEDGDLKIKQTIQTGEVIEYAELCGESKIAMGKKSEGDNYGKIYALLGSLSGLGETAIINLKGKDLTTAEAIGVLLMQA